LARSQNDTPAIRFVHVVIATSVPKQFQLGAEVVSTEVRICNRPGAIRDCQPEAASLAGQPIRKNGR
jgi:hypothetical protein